MPFDQQSSNGLPSESQRRSFTNGPMVIQPRASRSASNPTSGQLLNPNGPLLESRPLYADNASHTSTTNSSNKEGVPVQQQHRRFYEDDGSLRIVKKSSSTHDHMMGSLPTVPPHQSSHSETSLQSSLQHPVHSAATSVPSYYGRNPVGEQGQVFEMSSQDALYSRGGTAYPSSRPRRVGYLRLQEPSFGKEKHLPRNGVEKIIEAYNLRLSDSARSVIIVLTTGTLVSLIMLVYLFVRNYVVRASLLAILVSLSSAIFAFWLLAWILAFDEGTIEMREVAIPIMEGSEGFFLVQYGTISRITLLFAALLFLLYFFRDVSSTAVDGTSVGAFNLAAVTSITFILGACCSALSGYSGMWVSVRTNVRVASAARRCYNAALQLCFRGGGFSSIINVALAVGGIASCLLTLRACFPELPFQDLPLLLVGYGFGASLVAMFAQLGGGIYTKAADVGADLVGKIEAGIPEDDPRNPAVIADLVGDNVGDCAGQCADLFESIAAEIISAMILGGALAGEAHLNASETAGYVLFPLGVHCMDLIISSAGMLAVRCKKGMPDADSASGSTADPLTIMINCYFYTCAAGLVGFAILCRTLLYTPRNPQAWLWYTLCGSVGMSCAFLFVLITQRYTDYKYSKVRRIAEASVTGPATNIIAGLSVGMESTALPLLLIAFCVMAAYYCGIAAAPSPQVRVMSGLFGTAVATMGMLCTAVYVLTMSSFGPIADNAGGIVEMAQQEEHVRAITDRLDAVGNVTKANTKGFSVGTASLACFLLFSAFMDEVVAYTKQPFEIVNLAQPEVFVAGLLGAGLVFLFCAWALESVGRAAQQVVQEVRRQFNQIPGIMEGTAKPDYHTCVTIVSRAALREMIRPGLLSVLSPVVVGLVFRALGQWQGRLNLGAEAVAAFLMFSTAAGILMALFLNNAGGAWDNAKKFVETGALGGKNSDCHKAAVVGDTVGDPCKDTAGPSVHVLMKLVSTVTMVLAPVFVCSMRTEGSSASAAPLIAGVIPSAAF